MTNFWPVDQPDDQRSALEAPRRLLQVQLNISGSSAKLHTGKPVRQTGGAAGGGGGGGW